MSRFLLPVWNTSGHSPPIYALAKRLVRRGHEVTLLGPAEIADRAAERECDFVAYKGFEEHRSHPGLEPQMRLASLRDYLSSLPLAENVVAELGRKPADLMVADCCLSATFAGAEYAGTPAVGVSAVFYSPWLAAWGRFLIGVNGTRVSLGLEELPSETPRELTRKLRRVLVAVPETVDLPLREPDPAACYAGRILDPDPPAPWVSPWPEDHPRPLVVVSLSGIFDDQEGNEVVQRALDVLGDLPVRVLLLRDPVKAAGVRPPANAEVQSWAPLDLVLPHASLIVTNGGAGTVVYALAHGVPLLCLPLWGEQHLNGARVEALGAGRVLTADSAAGEFRAAIRKLLRSRRHRRAASRVAKKIAREGVGERAVLELERLAAA